MNPKPFPWNRAILVLGIALVLLLAGISGYSLNRSFSVIDEASTGKALVGGPFELVNQDGVTVTEKDFLGQNMLVYFGFTFCPDVCPTELAKIGAVMKMLPADANVTPVFITVDPERDGAAEVKSYVEAFHPKMVGLTGSQEQIRAAAKAYRVYFAKNTSNGATDYLMDHSSIIYLMGKKGEYLAHFTIESTPEEIVSKVREALED